MKPGSYAALRWQAAFDQHSRAAAMQESGMSAYEIADALGVDDFKARRILSSGTRLKNAAEIAQRQIVIPRRKTGRTVSEGSVVRSAPSHTRGDNPSGSGEHEYLPLSNVASVKDGQVHLNINSEEAKSAVTTSPPDGAPGNPKGTVLSRAIDDVAGTNISGARPENEVPPRV